MWIHFLMKDKQKEVVKENRVEKEENRVEKEENRVEKEGNHVEESVVVNI